MLWATAPVSTSTAMQPPSVTSVIIDRVRAELSANAAKCLRSIASPQDKITARKIDVRNMLTDLIRTDVALHLKPTSS